MSTAIYRAQRYLDFGYAYAFKERYGIQLCSKLNRYACGRQDRFDHQRFQMKRIGFDMPLPQFVPLLPRWRWK